MLKPLKPLKINEDLFCDFCLTAIVISREHAIMNRYSLFVCCKGCIKKGEAATVRLLERYPDHETWKHIDFKKEFGINKIIR